MNQAQVIELLKKQLNGRTQKSLAQEIGCTPAYLSDVLRGARKPGPVILKYLGLTQGYQIA